MRTRQSKNMQEVPKQHPAMGQAHTAIADIPLPNLIIRRTKAAPCALSSGQVLQLQQTVGNEVVQRLLGDSKPPQPPFHAKVTHQTQAATEKLLTHRNNHMLPLGRLGIGDNYEIFCRYVLAAPKYDMLDQEIFSETVQLFIYMLEKIGQSIERVAAGLIDLQHALNELKAEG